MEARVPLLRLKLEGISIDLLYAQVKSAEGISESKLERDNVNTVIATIGSNPKPFEISEELPVIATQGSNPKPLEIGEKIPVIATQGSNPKPFEVQLDSPSFKAIVGSWEADTITQTVIRHIPLSSFRLLLRTVRAWAKSRGIYSNTYGFLGGFSWALLTAWSCQNYDNNNENNDISLDKLLSNFFHLLAEHDWSKPISLTDTGLQYKLRLPQDWMPVITSISPCQNTARNVTKSTLNVLRSEFIRGADLSVRVLLHNENWNSLFDSPDFHTEFNTLQDLRTDNVNTVIATIGSNLKPLEIANECVSPTLIKLEICDRDRENLENCFSLLESQIIGLIIQLEQLGVFVRPHVHREISQNTGYIKLSLNISSNFNLELVKETCNNFVSQFDNSSVNFNNSFSVSYSINSF